MAAGGVAVTTPGAGQKPLASQPEGGDDGGGLEFIYLKEYFGHEEFRPGQREVVHAAAAGRDVAVFWATGAGKSLCYQLPALQAGKTVVVVSPLISLMQDQVIKFNATIGTAQGGHRACFLGSAQVDPQVEQDAVKGKYRLVYVTPEKICTSFLDRLKVLHGERGLTLLAVDEAHCISEWGHDFRPAYRELKNVRAALPGLPIMALTATAVPRVQEDILAQLGLRQDVLVSKSSFDRHNLRISCLRKSTMATDLGRIAEVIRSQGGSTIVYARTQNETESVAAFLKDRLAPSGIAVAAYHGGLPTGQREEAHVAFLSGKVQVIAATVAFGMGIDKPDIRRVVHYGPPKTVEEYFQQIGRAGRDGLPSSCDMISSDTDFSSYGSDFYTKGLTQQAKELMFASTAALRRYAGEGCCRRRWLLEYFSETPAFGEHCGTCDVCKAAVTNAGDTHRDFRQAAAPVLEAVAATESFPQALTKLLSIVAGTWKNAGLSIGARVNEAMPRIQAIRKALPGVMRTEAFTREMVTMLSSSGYLERKRVELQNTGRSFGNSFDAYVLTEKGREARSQRVEIRLPVPMAIRQQEEEASRKAAAREQEIKSAGFDPKKVPRSELDADEGPMLFYIRKLKHWRENGKETLAENHEELRRRVLKWRDGVAQKLRMAPADVLAEHVVVNITYVKPKSVESLRAAGARIVGVEELVALVAEAEQELFPKSASTQGTSAESAKLVLPQGSWTPSAPWIGAVYKPGKGGAKPPWEISYIRFAGGDSLEQIAMQQPSGKPVQVSTVANHVFTALGFAKPVDLRRLFQQADDISAPDEAQWTKLDEAAAERGCDVNSSEFKAKDVLCGVLGESVNRDPAEKSEADKEQERQWYSRIRAWQALKRARFPVTFGEAGCEAPAAKRQKAA